MANKSNNNRGQRFLLVLWLVLSSAVGHVLTFAQPSAPKLDVQVDSSNVVFGLSGQSGLFYTWQTSSDLSNWIPHEAIYANSAALSLTESGRVLQFRFFGYSDGAFWENRNLYGQTATPTSWNTEGGFGGDKAWPSPQSDWGWPPPSGFDGSPNQVAITNGVVVLSSPEDPTYRIRVTRVIELKFDEPVMRITTTFQRTAATTWTNKQLGTWIITQLQEPMGCYVPVPQPSIFANGYTQLGNGMPTQFRNTNGVISFTRDTAAAHKLGFDSGVLVWVGTNVALRIDAPRQSGLPASSYPDGGCSTEIYTNPGTNAPYVELESLGPLYLLPVGAQKDFVTTYTLFHRTQTDPDAEARIILNRPVP